MKKFTSPIPLYRLLIRKASDYSEYNSILESYSKYKFGSFIEIEFYANKIADLIKNHFRSDLVENNTEYIIICPPVSTLESPIYAVGRKVSEILNITFTGLKTHSSNTYYSKLKTKKLRRKAQPDISEITSSNNIDLHNKKIILIEDLITSGTTVDSCYKFCREFNIKDFTVFTCIELQTNDFEIEEYINSYIKLHKLDLLVQILNDARTQINRQTVRSLIADNFIDQIKPLLNKDRLQEIISQAKIYYANNDDVKIQL
jgi:predicted amidophosphoribosyltransferase